VPGLPYEDVFTEMQSKGLGMTGATAGRGVGGDPGAIVGQQLATGGLAQIQPWKPFAVPEAEPEPGGKGQVTGEVVAVIGVVEGDGSLTDLDTGEPVEGNAAAARLLGNTLREMEGMGEVSLDGVLRQLAGEGLIDLAGYPDRRLASVLDAGPDQASDAGRGLGLPTSDDPRGGPLSSDVRGRARRGRRRRRSRASWAGCTGAMRCRRRSSRRRSSTRACSAPERRRAEVRCKRRRARCRHRWQARALDASMREEACRVSARRPPSGWRAADGVVLTAGGRRVAAPRTAFLT
jgi:hypothetical protein